MTMISHQWKLCVLYACIILLQVSFTACTAMKGMEREERKYNAQVTLYLNGPAKTNSDVTFVISAINIVSEDGTTIGITDDLRSVGSRDVEGRQVLLGEKIVPEGKYKGIQVMLKEAAVTREGKTVPLTLPEDRITIDIDVNLRRSQNVTLFFTWNPDASVMEGNRFSPLLTVKSQVPELSSLLIYVTNEESDNVSVINRQTGEIAATVMVEKRPRGIAASRGGERLKVYVANSGSNSISVIDPTRNRVENTIPIRFGREPGSVAVASVSPDRELLFVANYGSNTVSVVDTTSYQELEKIDVGRGPIAVAVDPPVDDLTGTRFLSFTDINLLKSYREKFINVYVVNNTSNDISVLRIDKSSGRSSEVITLPVEWRPVAVTVDYPRGKVYIANYDSDKLSVIDIVQTVKGNSDGAVSTINNVGFSITDVAADPTFDRLYLLKEVPGEVVIIKPFSSGSNSLRAVMPPVLGTIPVGNAPRSIVSDPEDRKLYVVNRGSDTISVIDKTTKREEEVIPVGKNPYGIAVFPD